MIIFSEMIMEKEILVEAHIADIHFGAFEPSKQYEILKEQFIDRINLLDLDLISVNGDLFHHKFMSNSDAVLYAMKFINDLVNISRAKGCTLFILHGTPSHDANQTRLFYRYMEDKTVDVRVIETIRFEYVKGKKILCIPEVPGLGKLFYEEVLYNNAYDAVCMHGTIRGAIYGKDTEDLDQPSPVFDINNFKYCRGPIISGHVHVAGCHYTDFYYSGSPYRWVYGEEQPKGYFILLHNVVSREYYIHFEEVQSYRYDTINFDEMITYDPSVVISEIKRLQDSGIDNIRLEFTADHENINIIKTYFRNNPSVAIKCDYKNDLIRKKSKEALEQYVEYDYLTDKSLSEFDILSKYINQNKGYVYITPQELIDILKE